MPNTNEVYKDPEFIKQFTAATKYPIDKVVFREYDEEFGNYKEVLMTFFIHDEEYAKHCQYKTTVDAAKLGYYFGRALQLALENAPRRSRIKK
jgi:hypothetical protein